MEKSNKQETVRGAYSKLWPQRNLFEVVQFLEEQYGGHIHLRELSAKTGLSIPNLSRIFMRDDMRLSRAEELARLHGYRLVLFFPKKEFPYGRPARITPNDNVYPRAGNLRGLGIYIHESGKSLTTLSLEMGRSQRIIRQALETGDIYLSAMYKITEHLKIDTKWIFEKLS